MNFTDNIEMEDDSQNKKAYNFAYEILVCYKMIDLDRMCLICILDRVNYCFGCSMYLNANVFFNFYSDMRKVYANHFEPIDRSLSLAMHLKPVMLRVRMYTPHRTAHHSKFRF